MNGNVLDTVLRVVGVAIVVAGAVCILLALFRDRSRGRRRCPRCWYDMTGTPGLTCPECGRTMKREKGFARTRRRWRLAFLAMLMSLTGVATALTPRVRQRGWWSLVPTTVLVIMAPPDHPMTWRDPKTGRTHEDRFAKELNTRFSRPGVTSWQWRLALDACDSISTRRTWALGEQLAIRLDIPEWMNVAGVELTTDLPRSRSLVVSSIQAKRAWHVVGQVEPGMTSVRVDVTLRSGGWALQNGTIPLTGNLMQSMPPWVQMPDVLYKGTFSLPVRTVPTIRDSMTPVSGAAIDDALRRAVRVRVGWDAEGKNYRPGWVLLHLDRAELGADSMIALPVTFELVRDGVVVHAEETSLGVNELALPRDVDRRSIRFESSIRRALEEPGSKSGWSIRLRGDLGEMSQQWQRETYWKGEIEIPIEDAIEGPWSVDVPKWLMRAR